MKRLPLLPLALLSMNSFAESSLPFMKDWAQGHELPKPFGVGVDFFTMDQKYDITNLAFTLPGVSLNDPSVIDVKNEVWEADLKFDAWVLPFLNVFGILGRIEGDTQVDLRAVPLPQIPGANLGILPVDYDGEVYGGGLTLAVGGEHWFASLTGTYAKSSLNGDFDSEVKSATWQPRVGYITGRWTFFVGGYHIEAEENHHGAIALPGLGTVPFSVELESADKFNFSGGVHYQLNDSLETTLELGGGNRQTTLFNFTWRF